MVIDERKARRSSKKEDPEVRRAIQKRGYLERRADLLAKRQGHVAEVRVLLDALIDQNFWLSPSFYREVPARGGRTVVPPGKVREASVKSPHEVISNGATLSLCCEPLRATPVEHHALKPKKALFEVNATAVAGEAVAADHAMAGDDDRHWIVVICHPDRAHRLRPVDGPGDGSIAAYLAVWNFLQCPPDLELKTAAPRRSRGTEKSRRARLK